jgi:hypothetical protein
MKRLDLFRKAVTCYNAAVALVLMYMIVTSLAFSCEYFFGSIPAGSFWVFTVIGLVFAVKVFITRMADAQRRADRLSLESNKDLLTFAAVVAFATLIGAALIWGWIKLYPQF